MPDDYGKYAAFIAHEMDLEGLAAHQSFDSFHIEMMESTLRYCAEVSKKLCKDCERCCMYREEGMKRQEPGYVRTVN